MPKIIEFTGMPNSGKTTLIHNLQRKLQAEHGITVSYQREDAEIVPNEIPKKTWDRNTWITFGQFQSMIQAKYAHTEVVLLDRGYFDAIFWAKFMQSQGTSTGKQSQGMLNILLQSYKNLELYPDALFLIDVSVEESLRRRALMEGASTYSKPDYLEKYREKFFQVFKAYIENDEEHKAIHVPSYYFDTTGESEEDLAKWVAKDIADVCRLE